ncbi:MAG: hypothetical protein OZSIB_0925 [Candidatus Ozemobacter sibiricus]|uniref:Uncharacterized protein n=1 Tax=Candidatus Ozemobacter sibiricus TaxID=2268124 RepID=A0A367ZWT9_9BACT|nr:MAG: hypothetical protein OZSIB_0925 [Candidatus Ozemobacter sibiricus]
MLTNGTRSILALVVLGLLFGWCMAAPTSSAASSGDLVPLSFLPPAPPAGRLSATLRYIPFRDFEEIWQKHPRGVLIPRTEFERLRLDKEAWLARTPASPLPRLDQPFIHGRSTLTGKVADKVGVFDAEFVFEMPVDRWALLPLPGGDIGLEEVRLDGELVGVVVSPFSGIQDAEAPKGQVEVLQQQRKAAAAAVRRPALTTGRRGAANDFFLAVRGVGSHVVRVRFVCPQIDDPERNELTFRLPRLPMHTFAVTLEPPGQFAEVDRAEGTLCRDENGVTRVEGVLGPTDRFTLRWAPRSEVAPHEPPPQERPEEEGVRAPAPSPAVAVPAEPPRVYADSATLLSVGEGYIRSDAVIRLRIARSGLDRVAVRVPAGTEVLEVRARDLESWRAEAVGSETRVVCVFSSQIRQSCELSLVCDTKMEETSQTVSLPVHVVEGVERDAGFLGVEARTSIELRKSSDLDRERGLQVSAVDVTDLPPELVRRALRPILLSYRYFSPPQTTPLRVEVIRHQDVETLTASIDQMRATTYLSHERTSMTSLDLEVKNNGRQYLEAWLGSGAEIISAQLNGAPVKPSSRDDTSCLIPLGGAHGRAAPDEAFHVRLTYRAPIGEFGLARRLKVPLPKLDMRVSRLEWTLYAPESHPLLALPGAVERPYRKALLLPFLFLENAVFLLTTPEVLVGVLLVLLIVRFLEAFWKRRSQAEPAHPSMSRLLGGAALVGFLFVLGIVAGPMMGVTERPPLFAPLPQKQEPAFPMEMSSAGAPALSEEMAMGVSDREDVADKRKDAKADVVGSKLVLEEDGAVQSLAAPSPAPRTNPAVKPAAAPPRKRAGRDQGALPVDPIIPRTNNQIFVVRNDVPALEAPVVRVLVMLEPVRLGCLVLLAVIGGLWFLVIRACAKAGRGFLAWLAVAVYAGALLALEEVVPGAQVPGLAVIALGVLATLLGRMLESLRGKGAATVTTVLLLLAFPLGAQAQERREPGKDPRVEQIIDVYIPYSQLGERLATDVPLVFLTDEDYRYLRDLGLPEPDPSLRLPPVGVTHVACSLVGSVRDDVASMHLGMTVDLLGKGFKLIPFPTGQVGIRSLLLDGKPAVLIPAAAAKNLSAVPGREALPDSSVVQNQVFQRPAFAQVANAPWRPETPSDTEHAIVTDKEGRIVIEADLVKDLLGRGQAVRAREGFVLGLPPFAAATLDLTIDRPRQFVEIEPAARLSTNDEGNTTRVTAVLQPARTLRVEWRDRGKAGPAPAPQDLEPASAPVAAPVIAQDPRLFADHAVLFTVAEGVITVRAQVTVTIEQQGVGEFSFAIPTGAEVMDVTGPEIASWGVTVASPGQVLRVALHAQRRDQVGLVIELERATPAINGEFPLDLPRLLAAGPRARIERQKGYFGVEVAEGLEARMLDTQPATMVDPAELPSFVREQAQGFLPFAFKFLAAVEPRIRLTKHQEMSVSTAQIDGAIARSLVTKEGRVLTQLELVVRNNNNQFLLLEKLPEHLKILSVVLNGDPVKPGLGRGGEIYVPLIRSPLKGKALQPFGLVIFLEGKGPALKRGGRLALHLPALSLDIAELTWAVSMPEDLMVQPISPEFLPGRGSIISLPGVVGGAGGRPLMSNVQTQSVLQRPDATAAGLGRAGGGVLPVVPVIPTTRNQMVVNRKMVAAGAPTTLRLVFLREWLGSELLLGLTMVVAGLLASVLTSLHRGTWKGPGVSVPLILGLGLVVVGMEFLFGASSEIPALLRGAYLSGLQVGVVLFLLWALMTWVPPVPVRSSAPAEPDKPAS